MKHVKKIFAFAMTLVMALAVALPAFAQTVATEKGGDASITIANAAKGETYKVYKIFDATADEKGNISYTGTIPEALAGFFTQDNVGVIRKSTKKTDTEISTAVADYVKDLSEDTTVTPVASEESDGSSLTFTGLQYGYYGVTTTQGANVTVDSTNPNATIYDKNTKVVEVAKKADDTSYSIGDTITYTATVKTANYMGEGEDAKQVTKYVVTDTLPEFLSDVTVTSIKVGDLELKDNEGNYQQFNNKQIVIRWATEIEDSDPKAYTSLYDNGATLTITYTATLTDKVNINANNTNTVTVTPYVTDGDDDNNDDDPWSKSYSKDSVITTYAAAVKKTDGTDALAGAKFAVKGLTVTGSAGVYTVASYNPAADAELGTEMETDANGKLYIIGLEDGVTYSLTETVAPNGYNKLADSVNLSAQVLEKEIFAESGTRYYDAKGNLVSEESNSESSKTVEKNLSELDAAALEVENNAGTEMPSTGGIGTTIFYVVGGVMVAGAAIFLLTKRRMAGNQE